MGILVFIDKSSGMSEGSNFEFNR